MQSSPALAQPSLRRWMSQPRARRLLAVLAYAVSAGCLFWVFRGMDWHSFGHQFETLKPGDLCLAIAFSTAVYFVNSLRWLILLRPIAKVNYWRALQAVYCGLFLNEVLPLRPGELVRCYLLARWSKLPLSNLIASAAVERVLDGLCMMAGFFGVAFAMKLPRSLLSGATILAVSLIVITAAWFVHAAHRKGRQKPAGQGSSTLSAGKSGANFRDASFLDALALMANVRVTLEALVISCLALLGLILAMWFLMKGGGLNLTLAQAAAVFLIIRVGTVIPNAPGNIGSYQFFCVLAMGLFGIDRSTAAAFSLLIYSAFTIPLLVGGTIAVLASGLKFRTLLSVRETESVAGTT